MITLDEIALFGTLMGISAGIFGALWKIFLQIKKFLDEQEKIKHSLIIIKKEVTLNGGASMKDGISELRKTLGNIDKRYKILDQRSKAALHHACNPLFETDKDGRLTWCNEAFKRMTKEYDNINGHDWFNIIDEKERQSFISEIKSCLRMCRKIEVETKAEKDGSTLRFIGYPYKVSELSEHEGFLVYFYKTGKQND